jgi:hypothetical protein
MKEATEAKAVEKEAIMKATTWKQKKNKRSRKEQRCIPDLKMKKTCILENICKI